MTDDQRSLSYDPFERGPWPVAVRTGRVVDGGRSERALPFEVWYPQRSVNAGAAQRSPLIIYSHSSYGHRRQSSFLCEHLASHGYVVAAADHAGNTIAEWPEAVASAPSLTPDERDARIRRMIVDRVPDLIALCDELLGAADLSGAVDLERLGLCGWSFGGWAVLAAPDVDERFSAVVALAPGGASNPLPGIIPATLTFAWKRETPTLLLAAERDQFTPLAGIAEIYARTPAREKRLFVLRDADHSHFADDVPADGPSRTAAHLFTCSLALAHLDVSLRELRTAREFLGRDPIGALRARGVEAFQFETSPSRSAGADRARHGASRRTG
jgi:predicted dienelactone hydrolase